MLDDFDLRLLDQLQRNSQQTHEALGARVGLSSTAVLRRIRKLRRAGVIVDEVAILNPDELGCSVTAIVQAVLRDEAQVNREFGRRLAAHPAVAQCYYVAGPSDFVIIASFDSMKAYQAFADEMFQRNRNVRSFSTQIVLRSVKRTLTLPLVAPRKT